jgi:hypothetical protein
MGAGRKRVENNKIYVVYIKHGIKKIFDYYIKIFLLSSRKFMLMAPK